MLTGMFTKLKKGLVLKPKDCNEETTPYTMILKNRFFFLDFYKTAKFSKNWNDDSSKLEVKIKNYDFRNYIKKIVNGDLRYPDEEEVIRLKENIKNLPQKVQDKIYDGEKIEIFDANYDNSLYGFEIQKVKDISSRQTSSIEPLSKDLTDKFFKKALSVTNLLHP